MIEVWTGLAIYGIATLYYSLLAGFIFIKTGVIDRKMLPLLVGYILLQWLGTSLVYIYFPAVPSRYIGFPAMLNIALMAPQTILTTIYLYSGSGIIDIKWKSYLIGFVFVSLTDLLALSILFISFSQGYFFIPVPEILVLTSNLPAMYLSTSLAWPWLGPAGLLIGSIFGYFVLFFFLYTFGSISLWFYVWVKANKVYSLKTGIAYTVLGGIQRLVPIIALYLNLPYFMIYGIANLALLPQTILNLILIDKYRLKNLGVEFKI